MNYLPLLLNPLVLCLLVWMVAQYSGRLDFGKMFFIALGVGLFGAALNILISGYLGLLTLIPVGALLVILLMRYCYLTLKQALIVTALYFAYQGLYVVLITAA